MSNPFASLFGNATKPEYDADSVHFELSTIFAVTLDVEDEREIVILPNLIGEMDLFSPANVAEVLKNRLELESPGEYLLNAKNEKAKSGVPYLFECIKRLGQVQPTRQIQVVAEKALGQAIGDILIKSKPMSKVIYTLLMSTNGDAFSGGGRGETELDPEIAKRAINLVSLYGRSGALRWIFSTFAIQLKQADLATASLLLYRQRASFDKFIYNVIE